MESSNTGGVKPMAIAGRTVSERERLHGMTDEERAWRKQWLQDQVLSKNEPREVPEYWNERINPIRRFYMAPLNAVYRTLTPVIGDLPAFHVKFWTGKIAMSLAVLYATAYYFKYNTNDWTRKGGWRVLKSRTACVPGDEGYPRTTDRSSPSDYAARGFKTAPI